MVFYCIHTGSFRLEEVYMIICCIHIFFRIPVFCYRLERTFPVGIVLRCVCFFFFFLCLRALYLKNGLMDLNQIFTQGGGVDRLEPNSKWASSLEPFGGHLGKTLFSHNYDCSGSTDCYWCSLYFGSSINHPLYSVRRFHLP